MRFWVPLVGMTLSTFVFNTSEFMPIGLLTDIAADFSMTESAAGMLISVYAWAVMILSLPLMLCVTKVPPKRLLLGVIVLFGICQLLSAASVNFWMLMAARIGVAAAHAVFWSIITPLAVRVAPSSKASLALSMVGMGTSVAMIFGLPCGRMLGLAIGWRATFLTVGIGVVCHRRMPCVRVPQARRGETLHAGEAAEPSAHALASEHVSCHHRRVITAYFTGYGYIEPFFQQVAGLPDDAITFALVLFGAAGLLGSLLFARLGHVTLATFIRFACAGIAAALLLMAPAAAGGEVSSCFVCVLWGLAASLFNVSFNAAVIKCAPEGASSVAMSMYSGLYNLGIGTGTWLGGMVTANAGDRTHRVCGRRSCAGGACLLLPALCGALASSSSSVDRVASTCGGLLVRGSFDLRGRPLGAAAYPVLKQSSLRCGTARRARRHAQGLGDLASARLTCSRGASPCPRNPFLLALWQKKRPNLPEIRRFSSRGNL